MRLPLPLLTLVLGVLACQPGARLPEPATPGGPENQSPAPAWSGSYRGSDLLEVALEGRAPTRGSDQNARLFVERRRHGALSFALVDSGNGNVVCRLDAQASGQTAVIDAGQNCFERASLHAIVRDGIATLERGKLSLTLYAAIEAGMSDGVLRYQFQGVREQLPGAR